jgi:PST family polysaccharide transporter
VIATLTFAPLAIALFYTSKFEGAIELLRWLCLGMTLRVISWPMGFIILAKNAQRLFFFSELAWTIVYLGLAWVCITAFSLNGVGIAFLGSYFFHVLMIYLIVRQLSGFRWSATNIQTSFFFFVLIVIVFCSFYILPFLLTIGIGALATLLGSVYSIRVLVNFISPERIPRSVLRLLVWFRLTDSSTAEKQMITNGYKLILLNLMWFIFTAIIFCAIYFSVRWYEIPHDWLIKFDFFKDEFKAILSGLKNKP